MFVNLNVDEDSISDWSTDSCGWSDDDYGLDLDITTPPLSVDSGAVDTSDQEIVRCICEVEEENDFMIQVSCYILGTCLFVIHCSPLFIFFLPYIFDVIILILSFPQCEDCLCWQHGTCMGLLEDNVPDRYTCYICRDPPGEGRYATETEYFID